MDTANAVDAPARPSPLQALFIVAILIPIVACYYILGTKIGVQALFMGFLFSTYWGTVRGLAIADFVPTVLGGLTGLALAWLLFALPAAYGIPGLLVALVATIGALYFMIRQQAQLFLNPSFIVFLTVATIPGLGKAHMDYLNMAIGMLFGALYARALVFLLAKATALRRPTPAVPATSPA